MAATCNWGLKDRSDQWAYRVILLLQFAIPILMVAGGIILPESPRWLISKKRNQEALETLKLLRRGTPKARLQEEVQLLIAAQEKQTAHYESTSWIDCFRYVFARQRQDECN
jgi:hypothetical protein